MRRLPQIQRRLSRSASSLAVLLVVFAGASGCSDVACAVSDCSSPSTSAFASRATLDAPASVRAGEPFEVVVAATPRLSGVGTVRIVTQVGRLRVLAPVADTLDLNAGTRATTRRVRVVLNAGQPVRVAWTLAVDRTAPVLNPGLGAVVAMDSVRTAAGRLVDAEAWAPNAGFVATTAAEVRPIRVAGG